MLGTVFNRLPDRFCGVYRLHNGLVLAAVIEIDGYSSGFHWNFFQDIIPDIYDHMVAIVCHTPSFGAVSVFPQQLSGACAKQDGLHVPRQGQLHHRGQTVALIPYIVGRGRQNIIFKLHIDITDLQTALCSGHSIPLLRKAAVVNGKLHFRAGWNGNIKPLFMHGLVPVHREGHIHAVGLNG